MRKQAPTVREFIELLENGSINMCSSVNGDYNGDEQKKFVKWYIHGEFTENKWDDTTIVARENIVNGVAEFHGFLIVFDKELKPVAILSIYGGVSYTVLGNTVIYLGKNGVLAYDKKINEFKIITH